MDILVNFSDLVNKNRKDLSSWKAACDAVNNLMCIYPECFSSRSDTFAPLRIHANIGSVDGVDINDLETFLAKFLMVLDNEVKVEKVDFSGDHKFIVAGEHAAYCIRISGGVKHHQNRDHNIDLMRLRYFNDEMKDAFDSNDLRMLYHGMTLDHLPKVNQDIDALSKDLAVEFLAGGDRFSTFDISMALEGVKESHPDGLKTLEEKVREELRPAVEDGVMPTDFLDRQVKLWISDNDLAKKHLGVVFDQYSGRTHERKQEKTHEKSTRRSPKEVYDDMKNTESRSKSKGLKNNR